MPSIHFNPKYLPKMTCWFSLFKVFHLVIYSNKNLLCLFLPNSWTHLFLDLMGLNDITSCALRIKSSSVKDGWFGGGDHCGAGSHSVSVFPPNNVFIFFYEANFTEMRPWFTCMWFQVMICCVQNKWYLENKQKRLEYESFLFSPFPLRNKNKLKMYIFIFYISQFQKRNKLKGNCDFISEVGLCFSQFWEKNSQNCEIQTLKYKLAILRSQNWEDWKLGENY